MPEGPRRPEEPSRLDEPARSVAADGRAVGDDEDLFEGPAPELTGEALPKAFRARAETERRMREAALHGAVWAGMGAAFALMVTTAMVFRIDIVRLWPRAASAYAAIGLPVNRVGLTIENVRARPGLQDGRAALVVSGVLRNIRARPVAAPPLLITLLDKDGKRLQSVSAAPGDGALAAGQTRSFAVSMLDPPDAAKDLEVVFVLDQPSAAPLPAHTTVAIPAAPRLRMAAARPEPPTVGPPMQDAQSLPPSSPYALGRIDSGSAASAPGSTAAAPIRQ